MDGWMKHQSEKGSLRKVAYVVEGGRSHMVLIQCIPVNFVNLIISLQRWMYICENELITHNVVGLLKLNPMWYTYVCAGSSFPYIIVSLVFWCLEINVRVSFLIRFKATNFGSAENLNVWRTTVGWRVQHRQTTTLQSWASYFLKVLFKLSSSSNI